MRKINFFLGVWVILGVSLLCGNLRAMESATIKSVTVIDSAKGFYHLTIEKNGTQLSSRVDERTTVAFRFSADEIVMGDHIWLNQNVHGVAGIDVSIPLSPGASKWFGIPHISRVPTVPAFQKIPNRSEVTGGAGVVDGFNNGVETIQSIERSGRGVTLVMKGGVKRRFYLRGARLWKVVSPAGLKPGMLVKLDSEKGGLPLKYLLVG